MIRNEGWNESPVPTTDGGTASCMECLYSPIVEDLGHFYVAWFFLRLTLGIAIVNATFLSRVRIRPRRLIFREKESNLKMLAVNYEQLLRYYSQYFLTWHRFLLDISLTSQDFILSIFISGVLIQNVSNRTLNLKNVTN